MAKILTEKDKDMIAFESVTDLINVLKVYGISFEKLSEVETSLFTDIYLSGMNRTLEMIMAKNEK